MNKFTKIPVNTVWFCAAGSILLVALVLYVRKPKRSTPSSPSNYGPVCWIFFSNRSMIRTMMCGELSVICISRSCSGRIAVADFTPSFAHLIPPHECSALAGTSPRQCSLTSQSVSSAPAIRFRFRPYHRYRHRRLEVLVFLPPLCSGTACPHKTSCSSCNFPSACLMSSRTVRANRGVWTRSSTPDR